MLRWTPQLNQDDSIYIILSVYRTATNTKVQKDLFLSLIHMHMTSGGRNVRQIIDTLTAKCLIYTSFNKSTFLSNSSVALYIEPTLVQKVMFYFVNATHSIFDPSSNNGRYTFNFPNLLPNHDFFKSQNKIFILFLCQCYQHFHLFRASHFEVRLHLRKCR